MRQQYIYVCVCAHARIYFNMLYVGLWLHESGALGASPDALVKTGPTGSLPIHMQNADATQVQPSILEIKCPYSARELSSIQVAVDTIKGFFLGIIFSVIIM